MLKKKGLSGVACGRLALLATTLIWGSSFVILKNTLDSVGTLYILAIRFTGAFLLMLILGWRELGKLDMGYLKGGAGMGVCLFLAYVFQTYGLYYTTPGKNAFLTTVYCIMVPFIYWLIYKKRPDKYNLAAAFICTLGIGFVSLKNDLSVNPGDLLTLICGVFFGLHIIATFHFAQNRSPVILSMIQFAVAGILAWCGALIFETFPGQVPAGAAWGILYLCVMCTGVSFLLQTIGQKYTPPSSAAIILTLESVFGAAISFVFYGEAVTFRIIFGFALIFVSVLLSETKLRFLKNLKREKAEHK